MIYTYIGIIVRNEDPIYAVPEQACGYIHKLQRFIDVPIEEDQHFCGTIHVISLGGVRRCSLVKRFRT